VLYPPTLPWTKGLEGLQLEMFCAFAAGAFPRTEVRPGRWTLINFNQKHLPTRLSVQGRTGDSLRERVGDLLAINSRIDVNLQSTQNVCTLANSTLCLESCVLVWWSSGVRTYKNTRSFRSHTSSYKATGTTRRHTSQTSTTSTTHTHTPVHTHTKHGCKCTLTP
jgi:hypothetical protein